MKHKIKYKLHCFILRKYIALFFSLLLFSGYAFAQIPAGEQVVKGVVYDIEGNPIPGASVHLKGKPGLGTSTNALGEFSLALPVGNKLPLVFSFVGMSTRELMPVSEMRVVLADDNRLLEEVVVTGYQELDVKKTTGAFETIETKTIAGRHNMGLLYALEGAAPSLVISSNPGNNGQKEMTIRGISTLASETNPLIVLDGFPYEGDLSSINSYEIASVTLLKDAAAASIYGARSSNGVLVITTKSGGKGKVRINYSSNVEWLEKADINYVMNRVSASDLVDIETHYFKQNEKLLKSYRHLVETGNPYAAYYSGARSKVINLHLAHKEGRISEETLNSRLSALRKTDNTADLERLLLQTPIDFRHNLSASYGTENFALRTALNYKNSKGNFSGSNSNDFNYSLNTTFDLSPKIKLDLRTNLQMSDEGSRVNSPESFYNLSIYERLYDENGTPKSVIKPSFPGGTNSKGRSGGKDAYLIEQLKKLDMLDETYFPASDYVRSTVNNKSWRARFQGQLKIDLYKGLKTTLGAKYQRGSSKYRTILPEDSWEMRSLINNLTQKTSKGTKGKLFVPPGAKITARNTENTDYTLRAQLDYEKEIGKHAFTALLGSEIRSVKNTGTVVDAVGYDPASNTYRPINYETLSTDLNAVFHPQGRVGGGLGLKNYFLHQENRYFALYGNLYYTYNTRYVFSFSTRTDQSNLFGTDPKYRFKPIWSAGFKWRIAEEPFFDSNLCSKLDFQLSYGINGNISNQYGPFDIAYTTYVWRANQSPGLVLQSPAVADLRWEKTRTLNVGIQTKMLDNRLSITFDAYRKHTQDVLANAEIDPTLGVNSVVRNDASITNKGYELKIVSTNVSRPNFKWTSRATLAHNKGKVEKIYREDKAAYSIAGRLQNREGYAPRSVFVFDWAGVDEKGNGLIRQSNGKLTAISPDLYQGGTFLPTQLKHEDLLHAGTVLPKLTLGLRNTLTYKSFSLTFMWVYQGGHILMRDGYNGDTMGSSAKMVNTEAAKAWKKPGDETLTDVPRLESARYFSVSRSSTKNIIPADFFRFRELTLAYRLPRKICEKLQLTNLTLTAGTFNLFLWTKNTAGIDPETQGLFGERNLPIQKTLTFGINLSF